MKKTMRVLTLVLGIAVLTGCVSTVAFQVQKPPVWNTLGIQRVAVMPFTAADNSSLQKQAASWLTNESSTRIQATNHFTLVNYAEVERLQRTNGKVENVADAVFSGQVISVSVQESTSEGQYKDKEGNVITYPIYHRDVSISFSYNLSRTGGRADIIGNNTRMDLKKSVQNQEPASLTSVEVMIREIIQKDLASLGSYIAPHTVTERRQLESETSKDKIIKKRAKEAEGLVKSGSYRSAQDAFLGIYRDTGSFASAFNVGLLMQVSGDMSGAYSFLQNAYNETGNPKLGNEIARIRRAMDDAVLLAAYSENQSQRDKVVALMVQTLPSKLPGNPSVAFVNGSRNEKELVEMVINGIMEGILSKNITIVDRSSRALTEMERNYQLSGNVSDEEMVRIGHEAGVNAFIQVSITGSGAMRRLSVRVLDVERNTILYQSPQSNEMNL